MDQGSKKPWKIDSIQKDYTMFADERSENSARQRRDHQSRPARYVIGVRLSDDAEANIT